MWYTKFEGKTTTKHDRISCSEQDITPIGHNDNIAFFNILESPHLVFLSPDNLWGGVDIMRAPTVAAASSGESVDKSTSLQPMAATPLRA